MKLVRAALLLLLLLCYHHLGEAGEAKPRSGGSHLFAPGHSARELACQITKTKKSSPEMSALCSETGGGGGVSKAGLLT